MRIVCAVLAILAGVVLVLGVNTGNADPIQVAGLGIILAAAASIT